jgi:4-hydroxy-4-methyl-2-oxoglutarate aldolase
MALPRAYAALELVDRYERLDSSAVADAQQGMRVLHPRIASLVPRRVIAGPAFTVRTYPGGMMTVQKALLEARPGEVIVVDAGGDVEAGGLWGGIMSEEAKRRGLKAVVIDGAARDRLDLREVGFPTFAAAITPRLGTNLQIGLTQVPISCGGVAICAGDWIVGDDDGVVAIPARMVETILQAAEAIKRREREVQARVAAGENMADILGFRRFIDEGPESVSVLSRPEE